MGGADTGGGGCTGDGRCIHVGCRGVVQEDPGGAGGALLLSMVTLGDGEERGMLAAGVGRGEGGGGAMRFAGRATSSA